MSAAAISAVLPKLDALLQVEDSEFKRGRQDVVTSWAPWR
jgi:hypothetical protein